MTIVLFNFDKIELILIHYVKNYFVREYLMSFKSQFV
jgi:hypothetical protein